MNKEKQKNEVDEKVSVLCAIFENINKQDVLHIYCEGYADAVKKTLEIDKEIDRKYKEKIISYYRHVELFVKV